MYWNTQGDENKTDENTQTINCTITFVKFEEACAFNLLFNNIRLKRKKEKLRCPVYDRDALG